MPAVEYRANLSAKSFPFLSWYNARTTIINNGIDNVYNRYTAKAETDEDLGVPQLFYGHNFLPTQEGYASVVIGAAGAIGGGWAPPNPILAYRPQVFNGNANYGGTVFGTPSQDDRTVPIIWVINGAGQIYASNLISSTSYSLMPLGLTLPLNPNEGLFLTQGVINGRTFICATSNYNSLAASVPALTYEITNGFTGLSSAAVVFAGLDYSKLRGILAANGYLIAWTRNSVAWSSLTTPTDFVPSLVTGAGGGSVQEIKGQIHKCVPAPFGFILHCQDNCVAAIYTGNSRFPFKFNEITGAGGFVSEMLITEGGTLAGQIAYTTAGLQRLTQDAAIPYLAQLNDFIRGGTDEDFDVTTGVFSRGSVNNIGNFLTNFNITIPGKLKLIGSRYLIYSYTFGPQPITAGAPGINVTHQFFTHALVYDILLDRWGKLKTKHYDIFSLNPLNSFPIQGAGVGKVNTRLGIGLLGENGSINSIYVAPGSGSNIDACILLGKYQLQRGHRTILHSMIVQGPSDAYDAGLNPTTNYDVRVMPYDDGYTPGSLITPTQIAGGSVASYQKEFGCDLDATSFAILISGAFNTTSLELTLSKGGRI